MGREPKYVHDMGLHHMVGLPLPLYDLDQKTSHPLVAAQGNHRVLCRAFCMDLCRCVGNEPVEFFHPNFCDDFFDALSFFSKLLAGSTPASSPLATCKLFEKSRLCAGHAARVSSSSTISTSTLPRGSHVRLR
ncbi:MAG: hypothetical protein RLY60_371 [Pseudomonadota bacterium]